MLGEVKIEDLPETARRGQAQTDTALTDFVFDDQNQERRSWKFCNKTSVPRSEVVFFTQIFFIFIFIILCAVKLTLFELSCEESTIWISILSSTVGYILPNPRI